MRAECCPVGSCFDGNSCVTPFFYDLAIPSLWGVPEDGYRCHDGTWMHARIKYTPDREQTGYCAATNECLWNPHGAGTATNPTCVPPGTYIGDYQCEEQDGEGTWTSRTHLLAESMLALVSSEHAENDYTLVCDTYEDVMNNYHYVIKGVPIDLETQDSEITYVDETCALQFVYPNVPEGQTSRVVTADVLVPCANNFCVLLYASHSPVIGTTFNADLSDSLKPLDLFDKATACRTITARDVNQFASCDQNKVWVNTAMRMVLYSQDGFNVDAALNPNWIERIGDIIIGFFQAVYRLITSTTTDFNQVVITLQDHPLFDQLYFNQQDQKGVRGVTQSYYPQPLYLFGVPSLGERTHYMFIEYVGFGANVCTTINEFAYENYQCLTPDMTGQGYSLYHEAVDPSMRDPEIGLFPEWGRLTQELRVS